jgi:hypothetical protein
MVAEGGMADDDRDEIVGLGCALEMFSEHEEVINMIEELRTIYSSEVSVERAYQRFVYILDVYQEQPHLLDPHLENILGKLISLVRREESSMELKHACFKYIYVIMKVRGYKVAVTHLPHEVRVALPFV